MKVTLATHGGLAAGINLRRPPWVVDADTLDRPGAKELARLVAAAKAAGTPAKARPCRAPDEMSYTITVQDGTHQHVLTASDTTQTPEFSALLDYLQRDMETYRG
ncbi:MAG: protealysin inhibitor emfourin [Pseudonocardiaceae bacterium]